VVRAVFRKHPGPGRNLLKAGQKAPIKTQIKKFKKIELYY
jgi:hypothetical protein